MKDLRAVLSPLIRDAGVTATARRLGVSDVALHRWMAGKQGISKSKEKKLAQLFGYKEVTKIEKINGNNA
jgi:transcriptional regulator with XRE-family HTH domain